MSSGPATKIGMTHIHLDHVRTHLNTCENMTDCKDVAAKESLALTFLPCNADFTLLLYGYLGFILKNLRHQLFHSGAMRD